MNRLILIFTLILVNNFAIAQKSFKADCTTKYSCSQKYGMTPTEMDYILSVEFDDSTIKFSTKEGSTSTSYNIAKQTEKYVIGKNKEGNYSFFDIKNKEFYNIDFYMNRYMTAGYGSNNSQVEQTTQNMMRILKQGKTQKDVVQHLIEQTDYDF